MNSPAISKTTSRQKRVRTDPTAGTASIDLTTTAPTPKTNRSPTKSAIQALEGATASLPTSLHPLVLHFGNKLISSRTKRITKENIAKRMTREPNYIPKSDRIPSTTQGAEPPRDAKDSGSARPHSTHLETSSTNRS